MKLFKINDQDNVAVAISSTNQGESFNLDGITITAEQDVPQGHKIALAAIKEKEAVIKYGYTIGIASQDIKPGQWVHTHNIKTGLGEILSYNYRPQLKQSKKIGGNRTFAGYRRKNGSVGIRNEIWIVPTVSCVNRNAELIAKTALVELQNSNLTNIDGIYEFKHPYGCSQLGRDQLATQKILANLVNHPNAGGILVLGLGCENNNIPEFKKILKDYDKDRVKFLVAQDVEDEIAAGVELIKQLAEYAGKLQREDCPVSELSIGLKCGGSDGFSGITANPLVGALSDKLIDLGGTSLLTEVPEMFGAETILMNRCIDNQVFAKTVSLINNFKDYFTAYYQPIYENPSPGNKEGGISTLEEKSLGCTQKGGLSNVVDVLEYGDRIKIKGLNLLNAPGNDMVASTALAAAGCQIVLFTTGRGTPLGTCVPTVKIATNSDIYHRKANWMDFNAGQLLEGKTMEEVAEDFFQYLINVAEGKKTKSELMGFREIAIFKNGVTL